MRILKFVSINLILVFLECCQAKDVVEVRPYEETLQEFQSVSGANLADSRMLDQASSLFQMDGIEQDELIDVLVDSMQYSMNRIYPKYYTQQDMEDLITFFKTPIGQKFIENNQKISAEMMTKSYQIVFRMMKKRDELRNSPEAN